MKTFNCCNFAITPMVLTVALTKSGLYWVISRAQHVSLENLALITPIEVEKTVTEGKELFSVAPMTRTLGGIPSSVDDNLPPGVIELRLGADVLVRVENLAITAGMHDE